MIVSDIFCVLGLYTSQFINIPVCIKHKSKPICMPIYCVVMSAVKQESLANAKVRIPTQQQCMYESPQRRNLRQINARNITLNEKYIQWLNMKA